jgi:hypothetical protein
MPWDKLRPGCGESAAIGVSEAAMRSNVFNRTEAERLISALLAGAVLLSGVSAQAVLAAGVLIAPVLIATAAAEEPRHLDAEVPLSLADVKSRCAPTLVKASEACEVGDFGPVGTVADHDFSWARYDFRPAPDDALHPLPWSRVVIFERLAAATLRPILISGDDAAFAYDKPKILRAGGRVVLHVAAYESGTGNFNRELLYAWVDNGWRDVDVTGWLDELKHRLPKGLGVLKGVYPDYARMTAETPVWREQDGPPCPEGGRAHVDLQWRGDRIAVGSLRLDKAGECGEPLPR